MRSDLLTLFGDLVDRSDNRRDRTDESAPAPQVFFAPTGETTPMTVRFAKDRRLWIITLEGGGDVKVAQNDAG